MSSGDAQLRRAVAPHGGLMDPGGASVHCILPLALISQHIMAYHSILQHIMAYHNILYLSIAYHGTFHHTASYDIIDIKYHGLLSQFSESHVSCAFWKIESVVWVRFYSKILSLPSSLLITHYHLSHHHKIHFFLARIDENGCKDNGGAYSSCSHWITMQTLLM